VLSSVLPELPQKTYMLSLRFIGKVYRLIYNI
jgi:hypothetical protein